MFNELANGLVSPDVNGGRLGVHVTAHDVLSFSRLANLAHALLALLPVPTSLASIVVGGGSNSVWLNQSIARASTAAWVLREDAPLEQLADVTERSVL